MQCISPIWLQKLYRFVPCGRCTACRVNYATMWATRLTQELAYHKSALFLTLTYNNKNLLYSIENRLPTLYKRHLQLFFKRLRKISKKKLKYYAVGEYGEDTGRPHYHIILFGLGVKEKDRSLIRKCWKYCDEVGIYFGTVTYDSCRYTVEYIMKAAKSKEDKEAYKRQGMEPPFSVISNGIGLQYMLAHQEQLTKNMSCSNAKAGKVPLPRYYSDKLNLKRPASVKYLVNFAKRHKGDLLRYWPEHKDLINNIGTPGAAARISLAVANKEPCIELNIISEYMQKFYIPAKKNKAKKAAELAERSKRVKSL